MLYVITGPPAGGKTTWALARAKPGDIVIDYDRLAVALAGPGADSHNHGKVLKRIAHKARYAAIAEAMERCKDADVYLIHSMPTDTLLARYADKDAKVITCDPGRPEAEARCRRERPQMLPVVGRWYAWHSRQAAAPTPAPPAAAPASAVAAVASAARSRAW